LKKGNKLPGSGKSALSNQMLFDMLDHPKNKDKLIVLYWSFEMPSYQQLMRSSSMKTGLSMIDLLSVDNELPEESFKAFLKNVAEYKNYPIYFTNKACDVNHVEKTVRRVHALNPDKTIINLFDHSRLFKSSEESELKMLTKLSHTCIHLGIETECINILLSQLNRNIESEHRAADSYKPLLSDLFGADSVGQDRLSKFITNNKF
jgi:replicative DNA helicase